MSGRDDLPAVDLEHLAGDVGGVVAGQEGHHPRDLLRARDALDRKRLDELVDGILAEAFSASFVMSVSVRPTATALARIPWRPSSRATTRISASRPALAAAP
jgi:hypothetical protein